MVKIIGEITMNFFKKTKNIIIIALALVLAGFFPGYFYYTSHINNRTVTVKGLAEMEVKANLAFWKIKFKTTGNDLFAAQKKLNTDLDLIKNFLKEQGFQDAEITVERINTNDLMADPYRSSSQSMDSRYILDQTITLRTENVELVEKALSQISSLVSKGVIFDNQYYSPVSYLFTGLNEIKPTMLEQATKNAKLAADEFAKSSDSKVGKIKTANQGVFSVLPREQIPGTNESEQINKTVRVVSTIVYYLD